jgi:uncharacterized protein
MYRVVPAPASAPVPVVRLGANDWDANEDYLFAIDLFNAGYYWEAHTFWERLWAVEGIEPAVRHFLQGLVQLAAACLKRRQGELAGAHKLVTRARANFGLAGLSEAPGSRLLGIDGGAVQRQVERFVSRERQGPAPEIDVTGVKK